MVQIEISFLEFRCTSWSKNSSKFYFLALCRVTPSLLIQIVFKNNQTNRVNSSNKQSIRIVSHVWLAEIYQPEKESDISQFFASIVAFFASYGSFFIN